MSSISADALYSPLAVEDVSHCRISWLFSMVVEPQPGIDAFKPAGYLTASASKRSPGHSAQSGAEFFPLLWGQTLPRTWYPGACQKDGQIDPEYPGGAKSNDKWPCKSEAEED